MLELSNENGKFARFEPDEEYLACGTRFNKSKKRKRTQEGEGLQDDDGDEQPDQKLKTNWPHENCQRTFDPTSDVIPGNPEWKPELGKTLEGLGGQHCFVTGYYTFIYWWRA